MGNLSCRRLDDDITRRGETSIVDSIILAEQKNIECKQQTNIIRILKDRIKTLERKEIYPSTDLSRAIDIIQNTGAFVIVRKQDYRPSLGNNSAEPPAYIA